MSYGYGGAATGGNEGGGYMAGSQGGSQETSNVKTYGTESLRPVTIKQLVDATIPYTKALFIIDTADVATVTIVAQIQSITPQATNTTYKLDDGTGLIEVKQWTDSDDPVKPNSLLTEGQYVRVTGKLRDFDSKRHLAAHFIRPVTDFNEISYHMLEATTVHLYFTRGLPETTGGLKKEEGEEQQQGMFVDSYSAGGMQKKAQNKLSMNGNKVFKLLETSPQSNEGLHVRDIANRLGMPQADVFKAGDELLAEGMIYTTVDDETWAVLEY